MRLICVSFLVIFTFIGQSYAVGSNDDFFIVTAYYSPLPDQEYYLTGNYEDEIILNGKGIAGASGKKVFPGMLAAPKKYSFGTKIYIDGLGIGSIEDRGGAIVPAGERGYNYDRIDVWMGYGEQGLKRALFWGKRKTYGYVLDSKVKSDIDIDNVPDPDWTLKNITQVKKSSLTNIFDISIGRNSNPGDIQSLQDVLNTLGYLSEGEQAGVYDTMTIDAVYDFQFSQKIVSKPSDSGAGSYGPKTRSALEKVYNIYLVEQKKEKIFLENIQKFKDDSLSQAQQKILNLGKPRYSEVSPEVREFQKILKQFSLFPHKDTAIFGKKTYAALIEYQISRKIISNKSEAGAGIFGPKTRKQFIENLKDIYFQDLLIQENIVEKYQNYTDKH